MLLRHVPEEFNSNESHKIRVIVITLNTCKADNSWIRSVTREGDKGLTESNRSNVEKKGSDPEMDCE
jgi:hypothetical protein